MPVALVLCLIGMFSYGHVLSTGQSAIVCAVVQAVMQGGIVVAYNTAFSYGLDAYSDITNEIFIVNMVIKNLLFNGKSFHPSLD
jgi:hypothetical protein